MTFYLDKQLFYIDSNKRLTGDESDFTVKLNIDKNKNFDSVVLLDISIPKSYYLVNDTNNEFVLDENGSQATITIQNGNYSRTSLATFVENALNTSSPNGYAYVITYTSIGTTVDTGKYTFSVSGNAGIQPIFIFGTELFEPLGFDKNSSNAFVVNTLESSNVINLNQEINLFLHSDICQSQDDNVLQNIDVVSSASYQHVVFYNTNPDCYSKPLSSKTDNFFRFYLTDENDTKIDLNGQNMVFTVMLFQKNSVSKLITSYIKLQTLRET